MALRVEQSQINSRYGQVVVSDADTKDAQVSQLGYLIDRVLGSHLKRKGDRVEVILGNRFRLTQIVEEINGTL